MTGDVLLLAVVLAVAGLGARWWRRRQGRARPGRGELDRATLERLGVPRGKPLLLLFTAPMCATCDAARSVLAEISERRSDLALAEASVRDELALARSHGVLRAPTVLLVGADGSVRARIAGVPEPDALRAVVDA